MNREGVFNVIARLSGNQDKIVVSKFLIDFLDDIPAASMLSQLLYWSQRTKIPGGWIAKTYEDWYEEIRLKRTAAIRAKKVIEDKKILETKVKKFNGKPTVHYKILQNELIEALILFQNEREKQSSRNRTNDNPETGRTIDSSESGRTITENTQRIKTESKEEIAPSQISESAQAIIKNFSQQAEEKTESTTSLNTKEECTPTPHSAPPPSPKFFELYCGQDKERRDLIEIEINKMIANQQFSLNDWSLIEKHVSGYFERTSKHGTPKNENPLSWRKKAISYLKNKEWLMNPNQILDATVLPSRKKESKILPARKQRFG